MPRKSALGIPGAGRTPLTKPDGRVVWRYRVDDGRGRPVYREVPQTTAGEAAGMEFVLAKRAEFGIGGSSDKADVVAIANAYVTSKLEVGTRATDPSAVVHYEYHLTIAKAVARDACASVKDSRFGGLVQTWLNGLKPGWHLAPGEKPSKHTSKTRKTISNRHRHKIRHRLSSMIRWAMRKKSYGITHNPVVEVELPPIEDRVRPIFTASEMRKMLAKRDDPWWLPMAVMLYTGGRPDEAMHLRWENVIFDAERIRLWGPKTKAERVLYLQPELAVILRSIGPKPEGFVIENEAMRERGSVMPKRVATKKVAPKYSRGFDRALKRMGITKGRRHTYITRHTFVAHVLATGVAIEELMSWVGHRTPGITMNTYGRERDLCRADVRGWPAGHLCLTHAPDDAIHRPVKSTGDAEKDAELKRLRAMVDALLSAKKEGG